MWLASVTEKTGGYTTQHTEHQPSQLAEATFLHKPTPDSADHVISHTLSCILHSLCEHIVTAAKAF